MTDVDPSPKYVIALEEARRAAAVQDANFSALRSQAGGVVTTAGLCAAFLGAIRPDNQMSVALGVAVAAFVGVVLVTGWILLPVKLFTTQEPKVILGWTDEFQAAEDDQRRKLAEELSDQYGTNAARILGRQKAYVIAMLLLAVELVALVIDLWRR